MIKQLRSWFFRMAASGLIPAKLYLPRIPAEQERRAATGKLNIEIVSHCWNYSHFLAYQLSSLVNFPPEKCAVTMTVFYCDEDSKTQTLLDFFGSQAIPGVTWNWQHLPKEQLFRRSIGRNKAAKKTQADWIWFTDCDLLFQDHCLDHLTDILQGRQDALVFPREERCTSLLADDDPMLTAGQDHPQVLSIDTEGFLVNERTRATGPLQITHGDVARACGYCESLPIYMEPSDTWCKAYEDRAFRWLLRTQGTPLDIPGVYRIRHIHKGRYNGSKAETGLRSNIRIMKSSLEENKLKNNTTEKE